MSKISELSDGGVIQGGDTLIAVRSGGYVKVTYGGTTTANIAGGTIDNTVIGGTTPAAGNFTTGSFTGNVSFGDNASITLGASSDLRLKHTGVASFIADEGAGNLNLVSNAAAVTLGIGTIASSSTILSATSTGIDVTGSISADGLAVNGTQNSTVAYFADSSEAGYRQLQFTSSNNGQYWDINSQGTSGGLGGVLTLSTRGSQRLTIDTSGNVGIGTSAPSSYWANADDLVVATSGNTGISVVSGTTSLGYLIFADSTAGGDNTRGGLGYDHSNNNMLFRVNNDTKMTIDSAGRVGIGTSAPSEKLHVQGDGADRKSVV